MPIQTVKLPIRKKDGLVLRIAKGHFATSHSHINYYIDVTQQKFRLSEARAVAQELCYCFKSNTVIDTILCLDGTEVIGACMASELTKAGYMNMNAHQTIYVVTPEHTAGSQLLFRENIAPMIQGKNVMVLMASATTGFTAKSALEAIRYYGGRAMGVSCIFATMNEVESLPVYSIFDPTDFEDYSSWDAHECPLCKQGIKVDALVNSHGYSSL